MTPFEQSIIRVQERLQAQSARAEETIRQLNAEIEHLKLTRFEAKRECHNIKASLSWKLTWPLRVVRDAGPRLLHKSRRWLPWHTSRRQPNSACATVDEAVKEVLSSSATVIREESASVRQLLAEVGFEDTLSSFEPSKESVLFVTCGIAQSDALILAHRIAGALTEEYNLIVLILEGGTLRNEFAAASQLLIGPLNKEQRTEPFLTSLFGELVGRIPLKFAIVNSIRSSVTLSALWQNDIAAVHLINEFPGDTHREARFRSSALYSTERIFPSKVVRDAAMGETPDETAKPGIILPPGVYGSPKNFDSARTKVVGREEAYSIERPMDWPKDAVIVLGVGCIYLTKGVDLFVTCARRVTQMRPKQRFRFVWIDDGSDSQTNPNYQAYLEDQIGCSNLRDTLAIQKTDGHIENAYLDSDIVFESSWLNAMPFASIEALCDGKPVVCFESATGLAEQLEPGSLASFGVVPLFDVEEAALRIFRLIEDRDFRLRVGEASRQLARSRFCLKSYIEQVHTIARRCASKKEQEKLDLSVILKSGFFDVNFFTSPLGEANQGDPVRSYVSAFSSGIAPRKALPGFHPGVYQEHNDIGGRDPLAHYLDSSCPAGPWKFEVIRPIHNFRALKPLRIALHLHVHYHDGLYDIIERLRRVRSPMDLLVSVTNPAAGEVAQACLRDYSQGRVDVRVFDNCGRNLGPLLSGFGKTILERYDIVGHIHTKKSVGIYSSEAFVQHWVQFLYANLLADEHAMSDTILQRMTADDSIGLVFPDDPHIVGWTANLPYALDLSRRMGIEKTALPKTTFNFPAGTMFWARTMALRPLFELGLSWDDYPAEPLACDGTVLHAIERLLPRVAEKEGFRCVVTYVPGVTR